MLLLDERPPATAGSRAQNSAPEGWDAERTAEDAPWGSASGSCAAETCARISSLSTKCWGWCRLDERLLLDERPPATAGSRAQNSAPEGWDAERTAEDAPCGKRQWELRRRNLRANQLPQHQVLGGLDERLLFDGEAAARSFCPTAAAYCMVVSVVC